MDEGALTLLP